MRRLGWICTTLFLLVVLIYLPVHKHGFIWDDDDHLTANPAMTASNGLQMIWSSLSVSRYYPLTLTTFWVEHQLWGFRSMPYHLVNVALHAANAVLVFLSLYRLRVQAAWWIAAAWALHPVNVESVAWITELKNTQSGLFFFGAILFYLESEERKERSWYAVALVAGACAFLSKPSTVVLPAILLLCTWWRRGELRRSDLVRAMPFFLLATLMSVWTITEQKHAILRQGSGEWSLGIAERLIVAGKSVWFYAGKVLWPAQLTFVYPRWDTTVASVWSWLPLVGLGLAAGLLWKWRARAAVFGLGFFVIALLPVLGFFNVYYFRYSFVADHFQYLASLGIIAVVGSSYARLPVVSQRVTGVMILSLLAAMTWRQEQIYHDSETLWRDTLAKNPAAWMAGDNLGIYLTQAGKLPEAIALFESTLRLRPKDEDAHYNLGLALWQAGDIAAATNHWLTALHLRPDFPEVHNNLGAVLMKRGQLEEAIEHYHLALHSRPDDANTRANLALALSQSGQWLAVVEQWNEVVRLRPDDAEAHDRLGNVLMRLGQTREAIKHYECAVTLDRRSAEAQNNLGAALLSQDRTADAIPHLEQALRLKPGYAKAHCNLGSALEKQARLAEAREHYAEALRLQPDLAEARLSLSRLGNAMP